MYYISITENEDDIDNTVNKKLKLSSDRPFFLFPNTRLFTNGKHVLLAGMKNMTYSPAPSL